MAKKETNPAEAHLTKLQASKGKRVKYEARTHTGTGTILNVYGGKRGWWVMITTKDRGEVTVRPSQVKLY